MTNLVVVVVALYVYIRIISTSLSVKGNFSQAKQQIIRSVKTEVLRMYSGPYNLQPPDSIEQKCFQMNGHVGSIINRAIRFAG